MSRLCSACVRGVMQYVRKTQPANEEDVMRLERNDERMVRQMYNKDMPEDRTLLQMNLGLD